MALKFIITSSDHFRFGNVNLHRDLLQPGEECLGGGMYEMDYASGRMVLYGRSYDYGRPKWSVVDTLIVPASLQGLYLTYDDIPLVDFTKIRYE